jgi:hypothetical protein
VSPGTDSNFQPSVVPGTGQALNINPDVDDQRATKLERRVREQKERNKICCIKYRAKIKDLKKCIIYGEEVPQRYFSIHVNGHSDKYKCMVEGCLFKAKGKYGLDKHNRGHAHDPITDICPVQYTAIFVKGVQNGAAT